ncbi:Succinate dehydrogenase cytochrome B subunit, mitochondrial [Armadillidium nasatum]|uniref:Succinate dehydrogenase cytochrome B subunit, mitochondrial n=1 Tax=Armadillidium nasatum TaxID=96803 RepID=A0A5N5SS64_9CRUS|nr:Succinate dehydrogenase cytochrome B subunit, mitochondrial [Armadillidium nasatum]
MFSARLVYLTSNLRSGTSAVKICQQRMPFFLGNQVFYASSKQEVKTQTNEDYWVKNKRLNRPVSPHLTIYKPQITSMLSIAHRGTGLYLAFLVSGFSLGYFFGFSLEDPYKSGYF